jgi:hypothetical protein
MDVDTVEEEEEAQRAVAGSADGKIYHQKVQAAESWRSSCLDMDVDGLAPRVKGRSAKQIASRVTKKKNTRREARNLVVFPSIKTKKKTGSKGPGFRRGRWSTNECSEEKFWALNGVGTKDNEDFYGVQEGNASSITTNMHNYEIGPGSSPSDIPAAAFPEGIKEPDDICLLSLDGGGVQTQKCGAL